MNTGIKRILLIIFAIITGANCSFCADNSLLGIDVKYTAQNGYNITLKTDKTAQITKKLDENGNILLSLKQTLPSQNLEIINDNTEELTNIIVQKKNNENTLILLQGNNIANSKIYTKELSTGILKQLDAKNQLFYIADKKLLASSLISMLLIFLLGIFKRPKKKQYSTKDVKEFKTKIKADTLRKKNLIQSKNIPSINYKLNTVNTMPKDFTLNINTYEEEKIRKVG